MLCLVKNWEIMPSLFESSEHQPRSLPGEILRTFTSSHVVGGVPTDILVTRFDDRNMVIITQIGKVGTMFRRS